MKRLTILAAVLALAGCGNDDNGGPSVGPAGGTGGTTVIPPASDLLVNDWFAQLNATCFEGFTFRASGTYSQRAGCIDPSTLAVSMEEFDGTYTHDAASITTSTTAASCSDASRLTQFGFEASATGLRLTYSDSVVVMAPNTSTGGSGLATFGCFKDGVFTPSPLAPL